MTDNEKSGVMYYATGEKNLKQATFSAKSIKEHNEIPVTLYTNCDSPDSVFDNVATIQNSDYPFYDRINYFKQTPYKKTVYFDTDTFVTGDITPIFKLLDRFDIAAAFNESRDTAAPHTKFETVDINAPPTFPEYQCGVVGYRNNEAVGQFFDDWQERYRPYKDAYLLDQPHFREALFDSSLSIGTLPTEWNALVNFCGYIHNDVKIIHYASSDEKLLDNYCLRMDDFDKIVDILNENSPQDRVFIYDGVEPKIYTLGGKTALVDLLHEFKRISQKEGITTAIKKSIQYITNK